MGFGFRDVRTVADLIASPRIPKKLTVKLKSLISPKMMKKFQKVKSFTQKASNLASQAQSALGDAQQIANLTQQLGEVTGVPGLANVAAKVGGAASLSSIVAGKTLIRGATIATMATNARIAEAALLGAVTSRVPAVGNVMRLASQVSLGVSIIEELDPRKLRGPKTLDDGRSINASAAGRPLAETVAQGLMAGIVVASAARGIASTIKSFKKKEHLENSSRYFSVPRALAGTLGENFDINTKVNRASVGLLNQQGFMVDEIFYRLVLIAENIYAPILRYATTQGLGNVRVLEGFRAENTGVSPHERGEAIDITVGDGTLAQSPTLFELAQWAKNQLQYDQLILCHSPLPFPAGQAWLHISFSPETRRRKVLTKTFNDLFLDGLHVYQQYGENSEAYAADKIKLDEDTKLAYQYLDTLAARQQRLQPINVDTPESFSGLYADGNNEECVVKTDPQGRPYDASQLPEGITQAGLEAIFNQTKDQFPELWSQITSSDGTRQEKTGFMREFVKNIGNPKVGIVGVRGNRSDRSIDALAILNPTAGPQGTLEDRWDDDKRLMVVDVIMSSQSEMARWGWIDHTCLSDTGINPVFIPD